MIRRLERRDAEFMLEWMHDRDIKQAFRYPFEQSTLESVTAFIEDSFTETDRHFAVVDEADEYLGTISLKNISYEDCSAEYAIIIRRRARGPEWQHVRPGSFWHMPLTRWGFTGFT